MKHNQLEQQILEFKNSGIKVFSIGKSVLGRNIWCVAVGSGEPSVIIQYAIHAREYITAYLAIEHIKLSFGYPVCLAGAKSNHCHCETAPIIPLLRGVARSDGVCLAKQSLGLGAIYFIPCANPDGVALALDGGSDFSLWKANANAVDLNRNFDAKWGQGTDNKFEPASENYIGKHAHSEPETRALAEFTLKVKPKLTISYHSKGEEIYYEFGQTGVRLERDRKIAEAISGITGYTIKSTPGNTGGYKDWCMQKLKIPALTIEVGNDILNHPIGVEHLPEILAQNKNVPAKALDIANKIPLLGGVPKGRGGLKRRKQWKTRKHY